MHVCTMYRALCTKLHILVHVVRIPDGGETVAVEVGAVEAMAGGEQRQADSCDSDCSCSSLHGDNAAG